MTTNRIVYVPAHWAPIGRQKTVKVPTGEKKVGFFGGEKDITRSESQFVQTGTSDCDIDAERLADDIAKAVAELNNADYEVVALTPLTSGTYDTKLKFGFTGNGGAGYGYGFSFTKGVVITARKSPS